MPDNPADPFRLQRFVDAQAPVIERVQQELTAGLKQSHWMWFIFPQISGLGHSDTARFYAIGSAAEAAAYLAHSLLGPRLIDCTRLALAHADRSAQAIFGTVDAAKFRSCLTLFSAVGPAETVFAEALRSFFDGAPDKATLIRL